MHQQHVIDWWRSRGYHVIEMSDWSIMCVRRDPAERARRVQIGMGVSMKTRRHHNNKGERQVRRGKTAKSLAAIARKLKLPRVRHK